MDVLRSAPLTSERMGGSGTPPQLRIFSAAAVIRQPVAGSDWIAIGDAALAFDPLSGQGVLKSIDTGTRSASAIARCLKGDARGLSEYETWVKETHQEHLNIRSQFYRSAQRWPTSSRFWSRRAAV